ncbi:MAG: TolC family protein [Deltaproteobacteria bacterium]|nr:TolC family protein [Deltaproteobacteria bacterium]
MEVGILGLVGGHDLAFYRNAFFLSKEKMDLNIIRFSARLRIVFVAFFDKKLPKIIVLCAYPFLSWAASSPSAIAKILTPELVLQEVYANNAELAAQLAKANAENAAILEKYALTNPRVERMQESNMTKMQQEAGKMTTWGVSQELMFPTKYLAMGSAQKSKARAAQETFLDKKLEIRKETLTQFYHYYTASKILMLLEAQKQTLREIARIAEARRATGAVPQQDEMKAHVEQTKIENEILLQQQEITEAQAMLNALRNQDPSQPLTLPTANLKTPELQWPKEPVPYSENSKILSSQRYELEAAQSERNLAFMSYLPDFMVSFRKPYGSNAPESAYVVGVEMTVPLWFFLRQSSLVSTASSKVIEAEHQLTQAQRRVGAETKRFISKAKTLSKLLQIYDTALIPQATSALNSSRAAYSAGRVGFQELLDSERSLYAVRIDYHKNLAAYVETLTSLERVVGTSVSDLPMHVTIKGENP